jgi:hypothetical protein
MNLALRSLRVSAEDYALLQRRGESSQGHCDQAGRDGGTKSREENEPLGDLERMPVRTDAGVARR